MPKTFSQEERQLVKLVEQIPLEENVKTQWLERLHNGEMSEELADEMRTKISAMEEPQGDERAQANRARYLAELAMLVKRWRFSSQSNHFRKK